MSLEYLKFVENDPATLTWIASLPQKLRQRPEFEFRRMIVEEALSWVGTPWAHAHKFKGGGVDCGHLIKACYEAAGLMPSFDGPGTYSPEWALHRSEPVFSMLLQTFMHRTESVQPGDIATYNFGRHASHAAIVVNENHMIHAHKPTGRVVLDSRNSMPGRFDSYWSIF